MKISLFRLSTKDLATLAQRIISNIQSGKYTVINLKNYLFPLKVTPKEKTGLVN